MAEPTIKQRLAFQELLRAIEQKKPVNWQKIMLASRYSKATAINPGKNLVSRKGFQSLLSQISDEVILARIYDILLNSDKDATLKAADMLLKLKDKYPANKSKVIGLFDKLSDLKE